MSIIALHSPTEFRSVAPARRPSEAVYRRRRLVVGTVLALIVVTAGLAVNEALAGIGGVTASATDTAPANGPASVTALPGDTLWAIAVEHHGSVDLHRYLDRLVLLNGGPGIQAGQQVLLP